MASVGDSSLNVGLAALVQGDYPTAIAHLEGVCQTQSNPTARVRAQMGLVVAYDRTGQISRAIALCQTLSKSTEPQVTEWAAHLQAELTKRHTPDRAPGSTAQADVTGFVSFDRQPLPKVSGVSIPNRDSYKTAATKKTIPHSVTHVFNPNESRHNLIPLWLLEAGTTTLLFWLIRELLKVGMAFTNALLVKLPYLEPFQAFYRDPTQFVLLTLGILTILSPWLLDGLLRLFYGFQPLSINTLSTHSPEAIRVLQRYCRHRRWPLPQLGILPTSAPVALTYGNLPRTARIVVSQGLLEQLADDEIGTIYAGQLGHIAHWDFVVMSLVTLVTHLPYTVYRQVSQWGDQISNSILRLTAAAIASFAYGVWYLLSGLAFWLSQLRIYYSDRFAVELTGNTNGLTRALLKIAIGIASDIQLQEHTTWLLESLNLLTSVGYRQAIALGSLHPYTQYEPVLAWDCINPYRYWLSINNSHPLMGDRLQRLTRIAHDWHLETELNLVKEDKATKGQGEHVRRTRAGAWSSLLLQGAPFFGIPLGFAFGGLTWLIGGISILLGIAQLAWMYGDWLLIKGCLPIGFSIGTFVRINSFFPDIKPSTVQTDTPVLRTREPERDSFPSLPHLLANPTALPVDSQPVRLQGKLLGRRGISNCLGQDLILHSPTGLVKLHYVSWLGPVGNLLPRQSPSATDLVGQHLIATGWFRRGATVWIDIDILRVQGGKASRGGHPAWSILLASGAAAWGAYIILQGGA
jgi:Zn-dependent protease with chaperone function